MKDGEIEFLREHLKEICDFKGLQGELAYDVPLVILQRVCFVLDYLQKQNTELKEDIKNLVKIISKNCDELEATEEEFESLYRWENGIKKKY